MLWAMSGRYPGLIAILMLAAMAVAGAQAPATTTRWRISWPARAPTSVS